MKLWRAHWTEFTPFLAFPPEVRRVIYTTDDRVDEQPAQEGHPQPRPVSSEQAALKVLYLAVRNLEDYRGPNAGTRSSGRKQALQAFTIYFDGRIPTP